MMPRCRLTLADRTVALDQFAEMDADGIRWVLKAKWQETPDTQVEILATAADAKSSRRQLAAIHSLRREPPTESAPFPTARAFGPVPGMWMDSTGGVIEASFPLTPATEAACAYFDDRRRLMFTWTAWNTFPDAQVSGNHWLTLGVTFYMPDSVPVTAARLDSALVATPIAGSETAGEPPMWGTDYPLEARLTREADRIRLVARARPLVEAFLRTRSDSVTLIWCAGQRQAATRRVPLVRH
jgi:hypothetical protein